MTGFNFFFNKQKTNVIEKLKEKNYQIEKQQGALSLKKI